MNINFFTYPMPDKKAANTYVKSFYDAVNFHIPINIERLDYQDQWLEKTASRNPESVNILHFHWPEYFWSDGRQSLFTRARQTLGLARFLRTAKRLRFRIVWTVHNLAPHEESGWNHPINRRMLISSCDALLCHSQTTAGEVREIVRNANTLNVPHGNYGDSHNALLPVSEIQERFGIDATQPFISCLGQIRDYKGISDALASLSDYTKEVPILIAGLPFSSEEVERIRRIVRTAPSIKFFPRSLTHSEFASVATYSSSILLPYKKITGSGALLAAWTCGTPVIATKLPFFIEMKNRYPDAIELFDRDIKTSLYAAISRFTETPREGSREAVLKVAADHDWRKCVEPFVDWLSTISKIT